MIESFVAGFIVLLIVVGVPVTFVIAIVKVLRPVVKPTVDVVSQRLTDYSEELERKMEVLPPVERERSINRQKAVGVGVGFGLSALMLCLAGPPGALIAGGAYYRLFRKTWTDKDANTNAKELSA